MAAGSETAPDDDRAPAEPALQPTAEETLNEDTGRRKEEKDAEKIGEEAWSKEQQSPDQDEETIHQLGRRQMPLGKLRLDPPQDKKALVAHQPSARKANGKKKRHCRHRPDEGTHLKQQVDLDDRNDEKKEKEPGNHVMSGFSSR